MNSKDIRSAAQIVDAIKLELEDEDMLEAARGVNWTGMVYVDQSNEGRWYEITLPGSAEGTMWYNRGGESQDRSVFPLS